MNVGSETLVVNLRRNPGQPWGFRLQGGADFPTPLSVQMVNPGSISEMCGLRPGDAVLSINDRPSDELGHEDAKQVIVSAGDDVRLLVQRGAIKVWKPSVTPMSELRTGPGQTFTDPQTGYVQKTSLAAERPDVMHIGSSHNRAPKPFGAQTSSYTPMAAPSSVEMTPTSDDGAVRKTSLTIYPLSQHPQSPQNPSPQNGAPVLLSADKTDGSSSPTRSLSPTMLAIHEEEHGYKPQRKHSAVYDEPKEGEEIRYRGYLDHSKQSRSFRMLELGLTDGEPVPSKLGGQEVAAPPSVAGTRSVRAPTTKPPSERQQQQHMLCSVCGSLCVGVFVRIKGNPMHPECFKCYSCGKNLKNQGHFDIGGKLYCEDHARQASQPGPDMVATAHYS